MTSRPPPGDTSLGQDLAAPRNADRASARAPAWTAAGRTGQDCRDHAAETAWLREIDAALATLEPTQQLLLQLVYRSGLTQNAIAATTSLPLATVKKTIARGLQKVAAALEPNSARAANGSHGASPREILRRGASLFAPKSPIGH